MGKLYEVKNNVLKCHRHCLTEDYTGRTTERKIHRGMDLVALNENNRNVTDWVIAIEKGTVAEIGKNASIGNYIYIRHECGLYSVYYHLKDNSIKVQIGDKVEKEQVLAYMGNTGVSTGAHLHFGILTSMKGTSDIDPKPYLMGEKSLLNPEWKTGKYKLTVSKTIRTSCSLVPSNRVRVWECMPSVKGNLTSKKPNDIAMFKVGTEVNITAIVKKNGLIWGKLKVDYIVLCNADGTPQATYID